MKWVSQRHRQSWTLNTVERAVLSSTLETHPLENKAHKAITMTPNLSPWRAPHVDDQNVSIDTDPVVPSITFSKNPPYQMTYHEALDATLLLYSRDTSPDKLIEHADHLGHTGGFPAAPSFIESRLMGLEEPLTPAVALALERLPHIGGHVICPPEFIQIGHRSPDMPLLWNGHCDAWISEMDEDDWVIRNEIQQACEFEPEISLEVVQKRLIDLAPFSHSWVSKVLPHRKSLVARINERCEKWHKLQIKVVGRGTFGNNTTTLDSDGFHKPSLLVRSEGDKPSLVGRYLHPATKRAIDRLPECSAISRARVEELIFSETRREDILEEQQRLAQRAEDGEIERIECFLAFQYLIVAATAGSARGYNEIVDPQ